MSHVEFEVEHAKRLYIVRGLVFISLRESRFFFLVVLAISVDVHACGLLQGAGRVTHQRLFVHFRGPLVWSDGTG